MLGLLTASTFALALALKKINENAWRWTLRVAQLATVRYWVNRMEKEGLTVCRAEYRRMVAERKPRTAREFESVEQAAEKDHP